MIVPEADLDAVESTESVRVNAPSSVDTYIAKHLDNNVTKAVIELNGAAFLVVGKDVAGVNNHFHVVPNWDQFPFAPMYQRGSKGITKFDKQSTADDLRTKVHEAVGKASGDAYVVAFSSQWAFVAQMNDPANAPHPVALLGLVRRQHEDAKWPETAGFKNEANPGRKLDPFSVIDHYFPGFQNVAGQ